MKFIPPYPHCQARGAGGAGMKEKEVPPERHPMA